jgi:Tfp pilus assembly protein PilF
VTRRLPAVLLCAGVAGLTAAGQVPTTMPAPKGAEPAKPTADEEKAAEYLRAGRIDDALGELKKAAKANPRYPLPRLRLAEILVRAGQGPAARNQVEVAASEEPRHPAVYLANGSMAFGEGRLADTILNCQTALLLTAEPRWDAEQKAAFAREARLGLAAAFERRRDWAAAKEQLAALLNDDPKNSLARQKMAAVLFWLGGPEQAFAEFQGAKKDDPAADVPELAMAALWGQKDEGKAEEWLKKAVTANPKEPKAHRAYAAWLMDNGRADAAQLYVESAAQFDPKGRETLALKGLLARYRRDFAAAEPIFDDLNRDRPNDSFAAWNLALVLAESADPDKRRRAADVAQAEVSKNQRAAEGYSVLGYCLYKAGRLDEAERALGAAASGGQVRLDTAYFLARVLADRGKAEDAQKLVKEALNGRGPFLYRADAQALADALAKKVPAGK